MEERLQKIIAKAGICSRREAEQLILDRAVTVNGKVIAQLGAKADPDVDEIELRGYGRLTAEQLVYILINKPANVVTTVHDDLGRRTVLELLDMVAGKGKGPEDLPRLYPVGRLDFDAEGALILTNDGELAHMLMHPRHNMPKIYEVKIKGQATEEELEKLRNGVRLPDMNGGLEPITAPADVEVIKRGSSNSWLRITIHEGRYHQVKRMCEAVGHFVISLTRVAYGDLTLEGLESGHWRHLTAAEVTALKEKAKAGLAKGGRHHPRRTYTAAPGQETKNFNKRPTRPFDSRPQNKDERPERGNRPHHEGGHRSEFNASHNEERKSFGHGNERSYERHNDRNTSHSSGRSSYGHSHNDNNHGGGNRSHSGRSSTGHYGRR